MKVACCVVRDLLPLYIENMVCDETKELVNEHLDSCTDCHSEFEVLTADLQSDNTVTTMQENLECEIIQSMKKTRKVFHKKAFRIGAVIAVIITAIFMTISILLHYFPIYRLMYIGPNALGDYYSFAQIEHALSIGSLSDRAKAQSVLRLADQAFCDVKHTRAENEEKYGLLARYATPIDNYQTAASNTHSLELWSAHLDETEGWIWVYYSSETYDHNGNLICGSWRIPSLWKVEKADGEWIVVQIREHP